MAQTIQFLPCPGCRERIPSDSTFCPHCGLAMKGSSTAANQTQQIPSVQSATSASNPWVCPNCQKYSTGATCGTCGYGAGVPVAGFVTPYSTPATVTPHMFLTPGTGIRMLPGQHQAWLAAALSIFLVGTGQMFNRQFVKGVMVMLFAGMTFIFMPPAFLIIWLGALLDATLIAKRLHEGQTITDFQAF